MRTAVFVRRVSRDVTNNVFRFHTISEPVDRGRGARASQSSWGFRETWPSIFARRKFARQDSLCLQHHYHYAVHSTQSDMYSRNENRGFKVVTKRAEKDNQPCLNPKSKVSSLLILSSTLTPVSFSHTSNSRSWQCRAGVAWTTTAKTVPPHTIVLRFLWVRFWVLISRPSSSSGTQRTEKTPKFPPHGNFAICCI